MDAAGVRQFFDNVAAQWDALRSPWYDERVIDELAARASVDVETTVLDVGTGTGFVAAGLAPRALKVIGVDSSTAMLDIARRNIEQLSMRNVELVEGAIDRLPFPDDYFDAAVANMVLHHAEEPVAMIREMARVTRPGGWVAITDEVEHPYEWMRTEHADVWLGFSQAQIEAFFGSAPIEVPGFAVLGTR